jgi:hypothetical protein
MEFPFVLRGYHALAEGREQGRTGRDTPPREQLRISSMILP